MAHSSNTPAESQAAEIKALREEQSLTARATVPAMENRLYTPHRVLDHGFIRVVDYMGDDHAITQAARVSYGKGTKKVNQDRGLINYLMRHWHTTPFEMCEIKFHIKLPIFVARQWIRHRTANVNEYSARYSILGREFYIPRKEHLCNQSTTNKQGRGQALSDAEAEQVMHTLKDDALRSYAHYEEMMNCREDGAVLDPARQGLSRELARMNLTLNYYTEWYWKIDLHNLMHFLMLRADHHAQYEIRVYAEVICEILKDWVPLAYEAFEKYRLTAKNISGPLCRLLQQVLKGEKVDPGEFDVSAREWREFVKDFEIPEKHIKQKSD